MSYRGCNQPCLFRMECHDDINGSKKNGECAMTVMTYII